MTPDLARSLGHRIRNLAAERGVDPARLRRHLTFQRLLARLADSGQWVLKGGFCLEVRLGTAARATKDLDIGLPSPISADELGNPGWRVTVRATVGGSHFESVKLDVVARPDEIAGGVETLVLVPLLPGITGHESVAVPAVDVHQHAAEKLHAYARVYARDRPSSRVKDLVDLVLLTEAGVLSPEPWGARLRQVYDVRDGSPPPTKLPPPPASWTVPYAAMATELGLAASSAEQGWSTVVAEYRLTLPTIDRENPT